MKIAVTLIALLLALPFLECFCNSGDSIVPNCANCENDSQSQLPCASHDCLNAVDYFTASDLLIQLFVTPGRNSFGLNTRTHHLSSLFLHTEDFCTWFGKLKPHLALSIIQV